MGFGLSAGFLPLADWDLAEGDGAVGGDLLGKLEGEAAHGGAGVDLADGLPAGAIGGAEDEGVEANGAFVVVRGEEVIEGGEEVIFDGGGDGLSDEDGEVAREAVGGFGLGAGGEPLAAGVGFLMDET